MTIEIPTITPAPIVVVAPTATDNPVGEYFGPDYTVKLNEGERPLADFVRVTERVGAKGTSYTFSVVPKGGKTADSIKSQFPGAGAASLHAIHTKVKARLGDRVGQLTAAADRNGYGASRLQLFANGDFSVKHTAPVEAPKSKAKAIAAPVDTEELADANKMIESQEAELLELKAKLAALTAK